MFDVDNDTRLCMIEGCGRKHHGRGWCEIHYRRWKSNGDPLITQAPNRGTGTEWERFWAKVDVFGDCWEWTGGLSPAGYGRFKFRTGQGGQLAHRYAWISLVGEITPPLVIDHLCKNRRCVNPDHLEPVTLAENLKRGGARNVLAGGIAKRDHCRKGHFLDEQNTYRTKDGKRQCRKCGKLRARGYRETKRRKDE